MPNLPPPAPPETRTAGQLVAEAIRLYGRTFWRTVGLGLGPVAVAVIVNGLPGRTDLLFAVSGGGAILTLCYAAAAAIAADVRPTARSLVTAFVAGVLVFAPVPFLVAILFFPAAVWLAFFGLSVPVALIERRGIRESLGRAVTLARADFVHALGSLAALIIVGFISAITLSFLLVQFGEQTRTLAGIIPLFLISPLVFLGSALLYFDQEARLSAQAQPQ